MNKNKVIVWAHKFGSEKSKVPSLLHINEINTHSLEIPSIEERKTSKRIDDRVINDSEASYYSKLADYFAGVSKSDAKKKPRLKKPEFLYIKEKSLLYCSLDLSLKGEDCAELLFTTHTAPSAEVDKNDSEITSPDFSVLPQEILFERILNGLTARDKCNLAQTSKLWGVLAFNSHIDENRKEVRSINELIRKAFSDRQNIKLFSSAPSQTYAAILEDGSIVTWNITKYLDDNKTLTSNCHSELKNIKFIYISQFAYVSGKTTNFYALSADGYIYGGNHTDGFKKLDLPKVKNISSGQWHLAGITPEGQLRLWNLKWNSFEHKEVQLPQELSGVKVSSVTVDRNHGLIVRQDTHTLEGWTIPDKGPNLNYSQMEMIIFPNSIKDKKISHFALFGEGLYIVKFADTNDIFIGQINGRYASVNLLSTPFNMNFTRISGSRSHAFLLSDTGDAFLLIPQSDGPVIIKQLQQKFRHLEASYLDSAGVLEDGTLLNWNFKQDKYLPIPRGPKVDHRKFAMEVLDWSNLNLPYDSLNNSSAQSSP